MQWPTDKRPEPPTDISEWLVTLADGRSGRAKAKTAVSAACEVLTRFGLVIRYTEYTVAKVEPEPEVNAEVVMLVDQQERRRAGKR